MKKFRMKALAPRERRRSVRDRLYSIAQLRRQWIRNAERPLSSPRQRRFTDLKRSGKRGRREMFYRFFELRRGSSLQNACIPRQTLKLQGVSPPIKQDKAAAPASDAAEPAGRAVGRGNGAALGASVQSALWSEPVISPRLPTPFSSMNLKRPLFMEFATDSPSPRRPVTI